MATHIDFIADTSAIIGLLRRDAVMEEKVRDKEFAITFVTLAELSLGGSEGCSTRSCMASHPGCAW